jgi:hypothetical protein
MRRSLIVIVLIVSLVFILGVTPAVKPLYYKIYPVVNIVVNGKEIISEDVPAFQIDGRTMVPIRMVAEALKAEVKWDEQTRTVIITKEEYTPPPALPEVNEDSVEVKNISFNTSKTKITGFVVNKSTVEVDVKVTIDCYGRNGAYLGHVHVGIDGLEKGEIRPFQVEANEELKNTTTFKVTIDSIKAY